MVGENKKECKTNDSENNGNNSTETNIKPENSNREEDNRNSKEDTNGRKCSTKEHNKSVTLVENIKSSKRNSQSNKNGIAEKRKENKYLKGILKIKHSDPSPPPLASLPPITSPPPPVLMRKTEKVIQNPSQRYFGIKSYIDNFYYPPDAEVLNSGEFIQDDFEFVVEPGKRRWRNFWFKVGLWSGINLLLLGIIALLVGHLTHPRETIVARVDNLEILDRSAITFNSRLQLCKLSGITIFCIGGIILMLTLLISSYQQETTYYVMNTTFVPDIFTRTQDYHQKTWVASRIPLSGTLKPVQPR